MVKYLWVAPRRPPREQISFFRDVINRGKYFKFDYSPQLYGEDLLKKARNYDVVIGNADLLGVWYVVNAGIKFYKTYQLKFGPHLYRFKGFSLIYKFDIRELKKINGSLLHISRHYLKPFQVKMLNDLGAKDIKWFPRTINDPSTIPVIMKKFNAKDVLWITTPVNYEWLVKNGIKPIRGAWVDKDTMLYYRVVNMEQKIYQRT